MCVTDTTYNVCYILDIFHSVSQLCRVVVQKYVLFKNKIFISNNSRVEHRCVAIYTMYIMIELLIYFTPRMHVNGQIMDIIPV